VTKEQLDLLIEAGKSDWHDVEPAIFGTLLERRWIHRAAQARRPLHAARVR